MYLKGRGYTIIPNGPQWRFQSQKRHLPHRCWAASLHPVPRTNHQGRFREQRIGEFVFYTKSCLDILAKAVSRRARSRIYFQQLVGRLACTSTKLHPHRVHRRRLILAPRRRLKTYPATQIEAALKLAEEKNTNLRACSLMQTTHCIR